MSRTTDYGKKRIEVNGQERIGVNGTKQIGANGKERMMVNGQEQIGVNRKEQTGGSNGLEGRIVSMHYASRTTFRILWGLLLIGFVLALLAKPAYADGPCDYSPPPGSPLMWLKADEVSGTLGQPISTWNDVSGNSNHATEASSDSYPLYTTDTISQTTIYFDGNNDRLLMPLQLWDNPDYTILAVAQPSDTANRYVWSEARTSSNTGLIYFGTLSGKNHYRMGDADAVPNIEFDYTPLSTVTPTVYSTVRNGDLVLFTANDQNDGYQTGADAWSTTLNTAWLGTSQRNIGFMYWWYGNIYEFVVFDTALGEPERQAWVNYLKRWSGECLAEATDLAVAQTGPYSATVGLPLTYTVTIVNQGPLTATNVILTDTLPTEVTFGSATPSQGSCNVTDTVNCNLGNLVNGVTATVTIVVTPTQTGIISNTASLAGNESDPEPTNNTATFTSTVFALGSALQFDGENDYINLAPHIADYSNYYTGTISLWYRSATNNVDCQSLISYGDKDAQINRIDVGLGNWTGSYSDESLNFFVWDGTPKITAYVRQGHEFLIDQQWHHIAVAVGADFNKVYIDGVEQLLTGDTGGGYFFNTPNNVDSFTLGQRFINGTTQCPANGHIDDVRFWNKPLTQAEIQNTMYTELVGNEPGLVGYWKFNEGDGQVAADSTINGDNHGQLGSSSAPDSSDPTWTTGLVPLQPVDLTWLPFSIDNTANTSVLTDYQVSLTVDTAALIAQGDMRLDCGDLRFYDGDQTTPLSYWLEEGCNTNSTRLWVKVPSIPAAGVKKIYLVYGNPSLTSASDGEAVFELFDDFDGDTLDSKWATSGQGSVNVTSGYAYPSSYGSGSSWHGPVITASLPEAIPQGSGFAMKARFFWQHNSGDLGQIYHGLHSPSTGKYQSGFIDSHTAYAESAEWFGDGAVTLFSACTGNGSDCLGNGQWTEIEMSKSGSYVEYRKNGTLGYAGPAVDSEVNQVRIEYTQYQSYPSVTLRTDLVIVRKYVLTEPIVTLDNDLALTMSGPSEAVVGETINYDLTIQNYNAATAPNVVVTHTLPFSVTLAEASPPPTQQTSQDLVWQFDELAGLDSLNLLITGTVSSTATVGSPLVATATVTSDLVETDLTNNTAILTSTVVHGPVSQLVLTVADETDILTPLEVTLTAYDAYSNTATSYTGTVTFTSSDSAATINPISYTFQSTDEGSRTFANLVTFSTAGTQTLTVSDGALTTTVPTVVDASVVIIDQGSLTWDETDVTLGTLIVTGTGTTLILDGTTMIMAENIVVGEGATISANGTGYPKDNGPGAATSGYGVGAGHGGYGGYSSAGDPGGAPYGDPYQPVMMGSGGRTVKTDNSTAAGGAGGGAIHLVISDTFTLNGTLSANGLNGSYAGDWARGGGGGAGGSIWVQATQMTGNSSGLIRANGGNGGWSRHRSRGTAGAGGRIALDVADSNTFAGIIQAQGGANYSVGGPGTVYVGDSNGGGKLFVNNGGQDGPPAGLLPGVYDFETIQLTNYGHLEVAGDISLTTGLLQGDDSAWLTGLSTITATAIEAFQNANIVAKDKILVTTLNIYTTTLDVQGELIGAQDVTIDNGGQLKLYAGSYLNGALNLDEINLPHGVLTLASYDNGDTLYDNGSDYGFTLNANNVNVGSGSTIEADGLGYALNRGPGAHSSGASHAGYGGGNADTYGYVYSPATLGSSGDSGRGGGAIHLVVSDTLTLNGELRANGLSDGSGGSVWLNITTLTGSGQIQANGGSSAGGGGWVAVYAQQDDNFSGSYTANFGEGTCPRLSTSECDGVIYLDSVSPVASTLVAAPTSVVVGDNPVTVTVTFKSATGIPIPNKEVELNVSPPAGAYINGQPAGGFVLVDTTDLSGTVTALITSTKSEIKGVSARSSEGDTVQQTATITFTPGPVDVDGSTLQADVSTLIADGSDQANITASLFDGYGNPIPDKTLLIQATGQISLTQPVTQTNSQGMVTAIIKSTTPQTVTVTAFDQTDEITLTQTAVLTFITGPADPGHSTIVVVPTTLAANGSQTATITTTLRDALDHPLANRDIRLEVSGSDNVISPAAQGQADDTGVIVFYLASTGAGTKQITLRDLAYNVTLDAGQVTFTPGSIDPEKSWLTLVGSDKAAADGVDTVQIRVAARDEFDNPIPNATVSLTSTAALSLTEGAVTDEAGQADGYVSSDQIGVFEIGALVNETLISDTVSVTFEGADLLVTKSKLEPAQAYATFPVTYTLRVKNIGPLTATDVIITDTLPAELSFVSEDSGLIFTNTAPILTWQAGDLSSEQEIIITLTAQIADGVAQVTNVASATTSAIELNTSNNSGQVTHSVAVPKPVLALSPGSPSLAVAPGQSETINLTLSNIGQLPMTGLVVTGPTVMPWVTITPPSEGPGGLPDLAPGQQTVITLTAAPPSPPSQGGSGGVLVGTYRDFVIAAEASGGEQRAILRVDVLPTTRDLQLTFRNDQGQTVPGAAIQLFMAGALVDVTPAFTNYVDVYRSGSSNAGGLLTFVDLPIGQYDYSLITAPDHDDLAGGQLDVVEGAGAQTQVFTLTGRPRLALTPNSTMLVVAPEETASQEFSLVNNGAAPLAGLSIDTGLLPAWTYLGAGAPPVLQPGEQYKFVLFASPTVTESGQIHQKYLTVSGNGVQSQQAAVTLQVTYANTRDVDITATSSGGQPLSGATITLIRQEASVQFTQGVTRTFHEHFTARTASSGVASFSGLPVGYYDYGISKPGYDTAQGTFQVGLPGPGDPPTQAVDVQLVASPFEYIWTVTPITVGYEIELVMTHDVQKEGVSLLAPTRIWEFTVCGENPPLTVSDGVYIYNSTNTTATLASVHFNVPGVQVDVGSFPEVLPPDTGGTIAVTATRVSDSVGQGTVKMAGAYFTVDSELSTFTFNPTVDKLIETQGPHQEHYVIRPGIFKPTEVYSLTLGQPQILDWITLTTPLTSTFPLTAETEISVTLTMSAPTWLAYNQVYSERAPIILTETGSGKQRINFLDIEVEKTILGIELKTNLELGPLPVIEAEMADTGLIYARLKGCPPSSGGPPPPPSNSAGPSDGWEWTPLPSGGGLHGVRISTSPGGSAPPFPQVVQAPAQIIGNANYQVRMELSQRLVMEGEGFLASLTLENLFTDQSVDNININLIISDTTDADVTSSFIITPPVPSLLGNLPAGEQVSGDWLILPTREVTATEGETFMALAVISYTIDGAEYVFTTLPEEFTVLPAPELVITYELPEPALVCHTFDLSATVRNVGVGPARNVSLSSSQPRVVENTSNSPQGFEIIGVSVNNQPQEELSLNVELGEIPPGQSQQIVWRIRANEPGRMIEFTSDYRVENYYNAPLALRLSAITTTFATPENPFLYGCLTEAFNASGRVQDASSNPITDVVFLVASGPTTETIESTTLITPFMSATGHYTIPNLITGTYTITPMFAAEAAAYMAASAQTPAGRVGLMALPPAQASPATSIFSPTFRTFSVPPNATDLDFVALCIPPGQLSPIGQAVATVVQPARGTCGSTFEELITIPPTDSSKGTDGTYAFEQFAKAIREADYEVDFTVMEWATNFDPGSPGAIILDSIEDLFLAVAGDISKYPEGMTIRILMGEHVQHQTKEDLLARIAYRGIPIRLPASSTSDLWRIEVADYPVEGLVEDFFGHEPPFYMPYYTSPLKWSHVKVLIVDGETVIVGGYNVDDPYVLESSGGSSATSDDVWRDMGMKLSGEIAQDALEMFDDLWEGSTVCTDYDEALDVCLDSEVAGPPTHAPEVLNPPLNGNGLNAFSLFRDDGDPTAEQGMFEAMSASTNQLRLIQDRIFYVWGSSYPRPLYVQGIYNALDNGSEVQYITDPWVGDKEIWNVTSFCEMRREYALRHPLTPFTFEAKNVGVPIHTKSLAIDGQMLIVGGSNFDWSSWHKPPLWYNGMNLAEYNIAVDDPGVVQQYDDYFEALWNSPSASYLWCYLLEKAVISIQSIVDEAQPNDIVVLPEGIHQESVVIDKPLRIIGMSGKRTVIEPPAGQSAFRITSSGVSIHYLTVSESSGYGIELDGSVNNGLEDILIRKVVFENNASGGVFAHGGPMSYVIENNTFVGGSRGIRLDVPVQPGITSTLRNNIFFDQSAAPIKIDSATDGGVDYGYNLFNNCARASGGDCPTDWYEGTLSSVSNAHDNLLNLDPAFDTSTGYYTLLPGSPAIDAGDPATQNEMDIDGYVPERADIGAFETELMLDPDDPFQEAGGQVVMEAEHFIWNFGRYGHTWKTQTGLPGATGPGYLSALPDMDLQFTSALDGILQLDYTINFATTGTYYVWLRGYAPNAAGDSLYVALDDQPAVTLTGFDPRTWSWANDSPPDSPVMVEVTQAGEHVLHLWMREDGLRLDRIVLTTDSGYNPTSNGPAESGRVN